MATGTNKPTNALAGLTTNGGQIQVATTQTNPSTLGNITVSQNVSTTPFSTNGNKSGGEIDFRTAPGDQFTLNNSAAINSSVAPGDPTATPGNIVVLADLMSLGAAVNPGTISTGSTTKGAVVLGPTTLNRGITLGATAAGQLNLAQGDLGAVMNAALLQIGYRTASGTQFDGNITIGDTAGNKTITIDGTKVPTVELVTGTQSGTGGTIIEPTTTDGIVASSLGLLAGGDISLRDATKTDHLAGYSDGGNFTFFGAPLTAPASPGRPTVTVDTLLPTTQQVQLNTPVTALVQSQDLDPTATNNVMPDHFLDPKLSGVVVPETKNIILGVVLGGLASGDLVLNAPVNAYGDQAANPVGSGSPVLGTAGTTAQIGLAAGGGKITQTSTGLIYGAALEVLAGGSVNLTQPNRIGQTDAGGGSPPNPPASAAGLVAARAFIPGGSVAIRDDNASLQVDSLQVSTADAKGGVTLVPLAGVMTANGNIILETTTAGGLIFNQPVNAGSGSIALGSAATITQSATGTIITTATGAGAGLEIVAKDQVSLGAFGAANASNQIAQLAGLIMPPVSPGVNESFVVASNNQSMTVVGPLDIVDVFSNHVLVPVGVSKGTPQIAITGVTTNNANVGLRVTGTGDLTLASDVNVNAVGSSAAVGLETNNGSVIETTGRVIAPNLLVIGGGPVNMLISGGNNVTTLAAEVTAANASFAFAAASGLKVGQLGNNSFFETSAYVSPPPASGHTNDNILKFGTLAGVVTNGGNILLTTANGGDLELDQPVNANNFLGGLLPTTVLQGSPGAIGLYSAGNIVQLTTGATGGAPNNGLIYGSQLLAMATDTVSLGAANRLGKNDVGGVAQVAGVLAGHVTTQGNNFAFADDEASLTVGSVTVSATGF
ncbi:MAG: hypothetical protein JO258_13385, partial [Alphaproteobacteria bacterium]|nr:hypothetical protein [Alphaproteobacteria bacterium]